LTSAGVERTEDDSLLGSETDRPDQLGRDPRENAKADATQGLAPSQRVRARHSEETRGKTRKRTPPKELAPRKCARAPQMHSNLRRDTIHRIVHPPSYEERQRRNLEARMGYYAVEEHLRTIGKKRKGRPPTIAEVIMHDTPTGRASGKSGSLLRPAPIVVLSHPFGQQLKDWEQGVEVDCGEDWTLEQIQMTIQQGPHRSALTAEAIQLFADDVAY
jgi:hypothetical protein